MMEYALEAELNYIFGQNGCVPSYNSIVGGGANGCILHYVENDKVLKDGDLVLIDAACEYQLYASDITRTFPVNGKFSPEQKALYEVVLKAQLAAIDAVRIGNSYKEPHRNCSTYFGAGFTWFGLDARRYWTDYWIWKLFINSICMVQVTGWVWTCMMSVHTNKMETGVPMKKVWRWQLNRLYIAPDDETVDAKWRGIGIRIEDDVVVTKNGPRVLTAAVVKTVEEIEALMAVQ